MAFNKCTIILVLSLSSLFSLYAEATAPAPAPSNPDLEHVCEVTPQPKVCVDSVAPLLTPGAPVDAITVLPLGIKNFGANLNDSYYELRKLHKELTDPTVQLANVVDKCRDEVSFVLQRIDAMNDAVNGRKFEKMEDDYNRVTRTFTQCEKMFADKHHTVMEKAFKSLIVTSENNRAITNSIIKSTH